LGRKSYDSFSEENEKNLPWDLRQIYAKNVGLHMDDISLHRKMASYPKWFRAIEDLHTLTRFKFAHSKEDEEDYQEKRNATIKIANECSATWVGKSRIVNEVNKIETSLRELEHCIYNKMEEGGIFGKGYEYDEDEI